MLGSQTVCTVFLIVASMLFAGCQSRVPDGLCKAPAIQHSLGARAKSMLEAARAEDRGAGISAAVLQGGEVVWADAVGIARNGQALTRAHRMRIGSIAKPFTAVLVARLHDAGLLNVDDSVTRWVSEMSEAHAEVTLRQLGYHIGGIRQYDFGSLRDSNNTHHYEGLAAAFARHTHEPLVAAPRTRFVYSSIGFNLLGLAAERASGRPFHAALSRWVIGPIGLRRTSLDDERLELPCKPRFHSVLFGWLRVPTLARDHSDVYPSGGMLSTPEDLARMVWTVLRSDLLSPQSRDLLTTRPSLPDGTVLSRGFGWQVVVNAEDAVEWIGHGGTTNGAYASVRYYPRHDLVVAGLANYDLQLTDRRAAFFEAIRVRLPELFAGEQAKFED